MKPEIRGTGFWRPGRREGRVLGHRDRCTQRCALMPVGADVVWIEKPHAPAIRFCAIRVTVKETERPHQRSVG